WHRLGGTRAEDERIWEQRKIILPGNGPGIEEVEERAGNRLVAASGRENLVGCQMAEGRRRHLVRTVRERRTNDRTVVAIVDREALGDAVIEGEIVLVVEAHRVIVGRALAAVDLLLSVVHQDEAVIETACQGICRIVEVGLHVAARPVVLQVWAGAVAGVVKGDARVAVVVGVGVGARVSVVGPRAGEPVDAGVVGGSAGPRWYGPPLA